MSPPKTPTLYSGPDSESTARFTYLLYKAICLADTVDTVDVADAVISQTLLVRLLWSGLKPGLARPIGLIAGPARPKNRSGREAANVSAEVTAANDQRRAAVASHEQLRN